MEIGPVFDDIVDHPIMGREWPASPLFFKFFCLKERMTFLCAGAAGIN
jgi:hypothetical protein